MDVRGFDVTDDRLLRRFYDIMTAADLFERPWNPNWSFEEMAGYIRHHGTDRRFDAFAAFDGHEMVGVGLDIVPLEDNTDKVYAGYFVEPQRRRRGIGTALVEHGIERARALGRSTILTDAGIPFGEQETHAYALFAKKLGFTLASVEVHRMLTLPVTAGELEAMAAECAPYHRDYGLHTFLDDIPDALVESYCHLENQLAPDAPSGDVDFEAGAMTPATYLERQEQMREANRHRLTTLAIRDGEAVAVTDLIVPPEDMPKVWQGTTLVRRDHRGRHLGAAVKVHNLKALQERYPERTQIHTTNEETNAVMIGINERLGFVPLEICPEFVLRLD